MLDYQSIFWMVMDGPKSLSSSLSWAHHQRPSGFCWLRLPSKTSPGDHPINWRKGQSTGHLFHKRITWSQTILKKDDAFLDSASYFAAHLKVSTLIRSFHNLTVEAGDEPHDLLQAGNEPHALVDFLCRTGSRVGIFSLCEGTYPYAPMRIGASRTPRNHVDIRRHHR